MLPSGQVSRVNLPNRILSTGNIEKVGRNPRRSLNYMSYSELDIRTSNDSFASQDPSKYSLPKLSHHVDKQFDMFMLEEMEYFKPELSKSVQELKIQAEIIVNVFEKCIKEVKTVAHFHLLFKNNFELIKRFFCARDAHYIIKTFIKHYHETKKTNGTSQKKPFGAEIERCFRLMMGNRKMISYLLKVDTKPQPYMNSLVKNLGEVFAQFEREMKMSAVERAEYTQTLKDCYRTINERRFNIKHMKENLDEKLEEHVKNITEKNLHIERLQLKLYKSKKNLQNNFDRLNIESEKTINMSAIDSAELIAFLEQRARASKMELEEVIKTHQNLEKQMRTRKYKLDSQLALWIVKYDKDIGESQVELDALTLLFDTEALEYAELKCIIKELDNIYGKYKFEKKAEEERIFQRKLYKIRCERASKIIQRAWRAYKARRKRRTRKAGKGKSKKAGK